MATDKLQHSKLSVDIRQFDYAGWPKMVAALVQARIDSVLQRQGRCSVMLTGGRSAERLYGVWSELPEFSLLKGVRFYFGDERCVPADHPESNYGMVMRSLFRRGVPAGCSVFPMDGADPDRDAAARRYDEALPEKMDVLLLGVGEDGHVASLFPNSAALQEQKRWVIPITGPKPPIDRLTITPPVIANAQSVFVLAVGGAKAAVLYSALNMPADFACLPARLALKATWLLDAELPESNV